MLYYTVFHVCTIIITITVLPELPTADDKGRVPDPLEHLPDSAEVGKDIRAAAMSRRVLPSGK